MEDRELIRIVDAALAEATLKSGSWLVCRPGCSECCNGPFAITQPDAERLRRGLADLQVSDPARAAQVRQRASAAAARLPEIDEREFDAWLDGLPEDDPCPVLDPETGTCDLYAARPVTCRVFGPPIRWSADAVGVCELCFEGASDEEIAACEVPLHIEESAGQTVVALALS
jgi:Fe-S-cluster containining protein